MKYRIGVPVTFAKGHQYYTVDASSEEEALKKHDTGDSQWDFDDIEVQVLGDHVTVSEEK